MYQTPSRRPQYRQPQPSQQPASLLHKLMTRKEFLLTLGALLIGAAAFAFFEHHHSNKPMITNSGESNATNNNAGSASTFNKKQYSLDDPNSIWVIVNKPRPLNPISYVPPDLVIPNVPLRVPGNETMQVRKVVAAALEQLFAAAKADGLQLMLASGYRSYAYQVNLYNGYVQNQGQVSADQASARPGHSEHQTGLAADIEPTSKKCELDACFGQLPEGAWLLSNAYRYGFIIRYPADKVPITGYEYEPWHIRYIGIPLAAELHKNNVRTLEEYFDIKGGTSYN